MPEVGSHVDFSEGLMRCSCLQVSLVLGTLAVSLAGGIGCTLKSSGTATAGSGGGLGSGEGTGGVSLNTGGGPPPPSGFEAFAECIATGQCTNACPTDSPTTVSGTVYDPAGANPLYGVVVYVPTEPVGAILSGASCYSCESLYTGNPAAIAVTDAEGNFTLQDVPSGNNVPLVIQIGKWRRQMSVPTVTACSNTAVEQGTLTLPKNQSEGDIPSIAIATGGGDTLECLFRRIGIDASEYGPGASGTGRIHIFVGDNGASTSVPAPAACEKLFDSAADLAPYDVVLLSCEGHETTSDGGAPLTPTMLQALYDYAQGGGRVFTSHYQYAWFTPPPFSAQNLAAWTTGPQDYASVNVNAVIETTLPNGGAFPRGVALKTWLGNVGALVDGELPIDRAKYNAVVTAANPASVPWIVSDKEAFPPSQTQYFSADTPFGADAGTQCGRVVYTDIHVGAASTDYNWNGQVVPYGSTVPDGCAAGPLSAQEAALEFMLFDLSACITPASQGAGGVPTPIH
jgi:hypothetical protein